MKKKLLTIFLTLTSIIGFAQVSAGQVDDFEDGTVQNWIIGITGPLSPINVATGGPAGVGFRNGSGSGQRGPAFR